MGWLARPAAFCAGLRGWPRRGLAFLLGAAMTAAMPPLHLLPLIVVAATGLCWLLDGARGWRARFGVVWWFGFAHYMAGLYWIGEAFFVDAERYALLSPFPVVVLPAIIALIPATGFAFLPWDRVRPLARPFLLAAAWIGIDWLRAYGLLGFPWNLAGMVWDVSGPMLQGVAFLGIFGVSLLTLVLAALPALLAQPGRVPLVMVSAGSMLVVLWWIGGSARLAAAGEESVPGVRLRLVQANISQQMKWKDAERLQNLEAHVALSTAPAALRPTHVIWPETAVPYLLDSDPILLRILEDRLGAETVLLAGALRRTPMGQPIRIWNSLHAITSGGVVATYDKQHLVPFGEFLPYRPWLSLIGLDRVALSDLDFSVGDGPGTIAIPAAPPARALICYEAIFPAETRASSEGAGWLLNVTNDAWFGTSAGPYQHFALARARAVELGLPLVRVAGTGISAVVDAHGRVLGRIPLHHKGFLDAALPRALARPTIYARFGDAVFLGLLGLIVVVIVSIGRIKEDKLS